MHCENIDGTAIVVRDKTLPSIAVNQHIIIL